MWMFEVASAYSSKRSTLWQKLPKARSLLLLFQWQLCSVVTITDNKRQMLCLLNSKWQLHLSYTEVEMFLTYFWKKHTDIMLKCSSHILAGIYMYACMLPMPPGHQCYQAIHTICITHHYTQALLMHISLLARWACTDQC